MRSVIVMLFLLLASASLASSSELTLSGDPAVHLMLDREYGVIVIGNKGFFTERCGSEVMAGEE